MAGLLKGNETAKLTYTHSHITVNTVTPPNPIISPKGHSHACVLPVKPSYTNECWRLELRFFVQKQQEAEVTVQMLVHCAHISQTAKFRHSYCLFREVASPGGWGEQAREMYCKRRFSVFMEGWVQLLIWSIWEQDTPQRGHNAMGGVGVPLAQSAPPPHWFTAETRQQIKSGLTRKLKRRPGNGLEVAG